MNRDRGGLRDISAVDVLDSLTAHIAVLDADARIIYVNSAWLGFAQANACPDPDAYIGRDYLAVCEASAQRGDNLAATARDGIISVMSGARTRFTLEYPCHAHSHRSWFIMRVTRYLAEGRPHVVVSHQNITARKLADAELRRTEAELERVNHELSMALERERRLANTDGLTEIGNRRYFFEVAKHAFAAAKRHDRPLSLILFDIDHFKRVNDIAGHQAGDEVLKRIALIATANIRSADFLARYGGEEFIALLPDSTASEATQVAERIRTEIAEICRFSGAQMLNITVSLGIAAFPEAGGTLTDLIRCADHALYQAKSGGRNRWVSYAGARGT